LALWVYCGSMVENLLTKVYLDPGVYRGPCMKNMALNQPITYTYAKSITDEVVYFHLCSRLYLKQNGP